MELTNSDVEQALANLESSQLELSNLFETNLGNQYVFNHTDHTWSESGDYIYLTVTEDEMYESIRVREEFIKGNYKLVYAMEQNYHSSRHTDKWFNMAFFLLDTRYEV